MGASLRLSAWWVVIIAATVVATARGQTPEEKLAAAQARLDRLYMVEQRIWATQPSRREAPLRELNVTDAEVREIRSAVATVVPDSLVYISGVVKGCPCEDGTACTDQVWVEAQHPNKGRGLLLSKIREHWTVGPVQQWWLDFEAFEARTPHYPALEDFKGREDLELQFPACLDKATPPRRLTR